MRLLLPLATLAFLGCGENNLNRVLRTDEFDQAPSNQVDILWVVDNSTSMAEEQDAVATAAEDFLGQLEYASMDFHLGVVTTDVSDTNLEGGVLLGSPNVINSDCLADGDSSDCTYAEAFSTVVRQGTDGDDQEKGLQAAVRAVTPPLVDTYNAGFLRDDALLMIIILADENDCSDNGALGPIATGEDCYTRYDELTPVSNLVEQLRAARPEGKVVVNGIIGPDIADHCDDSVPGKRYSQAIDMLGGVEADICLDDYTSVMSNLGLVATGILDTFQLSYAADPESIEVEVTPVDGEPVAVAQDDVEGWSYLADYAQVKFNGSSVPERGAHIEISYYVAGPVPDGTATSGTTADTGS